MRATAEFDMEDFENPDKSDYKTLCRFHLVPMKDAAASAEAGRPIYRDVEFVELIIPGNPTNRPNIKVTSIERQKYARQYKAWKDSGMAEVGAVGTPLIEVPWITRSQVEELAYLRIRSLEELAEVNDGAVQRMMGLGVLRDRAKEHLERAEKAAPFTKIQEQLDALVAQNAALQGVVDEQAERIKELETKKGK